MRYPISIRGIEMGSAEYAKLDQGYREVELNVLKANDDIESLVADALGRFDDHLYAGGPHRTHWWM